MRIYDTTNGCVMTTDKARTLAKEKADQDATKDFVADRKRLNKELADARLQEEKRAYSVLFRKSLSKRRAELASMSIEVYLRKTRTIPERREVAKTEGEDASGGGSGARRSRRLSKWHWKNSMNFCLSIGPLFHLSYVIPDFGRSPAVYLYRAITRSSLFQLQ